MKVELEIHPNHYEQKSEKGCADCIHSKVCGAWQQFNAIVEKSGKYNIQFDCSDYLPSP